MCFVSSCVRHSDVGGVTWSGLTATELGDEGVVLDGVVLGHTPDSFTEHALVAALPLPQAGV